ncbi:MAG TPA: malto-oligosyltrehalose trehalohydrolase [Rhodanobacteraceae bacterium]|nr:malto-oligosyltrehalose trehalohydrolase [Rhodanobacteraceae bacterium]
MSSGAAHAMPFGATLLTPERTRFRLWAPAQTAVTLVADHHGRVPMRAAADGWHEVDLDCGAGTRYRYELADGHCVPDPASRAQHGDADGASIVVDPCAYAWQQPQWRGRPWREAVIYELHVGLCGGFAGVIDELDRLVKLGVTAIELMPIGEFSGSRNWGYDGVLQFAPEASYGTPEDLKRLIDAAHARDLMVFLDVVYNHFGPRENWLGRYAPQFFRDDVHTPWGSALDFRRPQVRQFFLDNALYWIGEYRFDGLRLDAVHAIGDNGWLRQLAQRVRGECAGREVHLIVENEDNNAELLENGFDAQWNDDFHNALHVVLTGEHEGYYIDYAAAPTTLLARALCEGFVYQGQASTWRKGRARGTPSAHLSPLCFVDFLQNHDQVGNRAFGERLSSLVDAAGWHAAMELLLLSPSIPMLFMGDEWSAREPFLYFTDYDDGFATEVREGRRREFAAFAGFADPHRRAEIPDPNAVETFERSRLHRPATAEAEARWLAGLLELRARELVPRLEGCRASGAEVLGVGALRVDWRLGDGSGYSLWCNLGTQAVRCAVPRAADGAGEAPRPLIDTAAWSHLGDGVLDPRTTLAALGTRLP